MRWSNFCKIDFKASNLMKHTTILVLLLYSPSPKCGILPRDFLRFFWGDGGTQPPVVLGLQPSSLQSWLVSTWAGCQVTVVAVGVRHEAWLL